MSTIGCLRDSFSLCGGDWKWDAHGFEVASAVQCCMCTQVVQRCLSVSVVPLSVQGVKLWVFCPSLYDGTWDLTKAGMSLGGTSIYR